MNGLKHTEWQKKAMLCPEIEADLENLKGTGYDKYPVSPKTLLFPKGYNCIAFAAGDQNRWWWPHFNKFCYYWPPHLPREPVNQETLENFMARLNGRDTKYATMDSLRLVLRRLLFLQKTASQNTRPASWNLVFGPANVESCKTSNMKHWPRLRGMCMARRIHFFIVGGTAILFDLI